MGMILLLMIIQNILLKNTLTEEKLRGHRRRCAGWPRRAGRRLQRDHREEARRAPPQPAGPEEIVVRLRQEHETVGRSPESEDAWFSPIPGRLASSVHRRTHTL